MRPFLRPSQVPSIFSCYDIKYCYCTPTLSTSRCLPARCSSLVPSLSRHFRSASSYDVDGSKARGKMTSVLEASNLDDFIASAMMSERAFESHKENTVVVGPDGVEMTLDENGEINAAGGAKDTGGADFDFEHMNVPRRPAWGAEMTAEELDLLERRSFLEWRRGIAE